MGQFSPLQIHTDSALLADRALVCCLHVEVVASLVQVVSTGHGDDGSRGGKQVVATDRTIVVHSARVALVCCGAGYSDTDVATLCLISSSPQQHQESYLAVVEVFTKTFTSPANTAVRAMVDLLFAVVVP